MAGFPGRLSSAAPTGSPRLPIVTLSPSPPVAAAASWTVSFEPDGAFSCVPSAGVGACQATRSAPGRAEAVLATTPNTSTMTSAHAVRAWARSSRMSGAASIEAVPDASSAAAQSTVTGVPTGIIRASRRMSPFFSRIHPCETAPGRSSGLSVPWMPM